MRIGKTAGLLLSGALLAMLAGFIATQTATIDNVAPRRDTSGSIVDAHDGCMVQFGGRYYIYGTTYGSNNGWGPTNYYRCYSSDDLRTWKLETDGLLQSPPPGIFFRPYVIYNAASRKYVLWFLWYDGFTGSQWVGGYYGTATSDVPQGPFVIANPKVSTVDSVPGDQGLFVDDDGTAYQIHTNYNRTSTNMAIRIEKLTTDYLDSTLENSGILTLWCEAPALFKRHDVYYALFDTGCAFCQEGSGAQVWTASNPLGPYTYRNNINRDGANNPIIPAQQTYVSKIKTPGGDAYVWIGDRWGSTPDGVKGHDFQYWSSPLQFDADGNIAPLSWTDQWNLEISAGGSTAAATSSSRGGRCGATGWEPVLLLGLLRLARRPRDRRTRPLP